MSEFDSLSAELQDFESSLARLTPAASRIDRDRLMFRLGQESVRRRGQPWQIVWPLTSAALLLLCSTLGWQLARSAGPLVVMVDRPLAPEEYSPTATAPREVVVDDKPLEPSEPVRLSRLAMHSAWLDARSVLGVRGLQPAKIEAAWQDAPRSVPKRRPAPEPAALRVGDRNAWEKWFEGRPSEDSQANSIQKDSA